jgi:hypothetical protein
VISPCRTAIRAGVCAAVMVLGFTVTMPAARADEEAAPAHKLAVTLGAFFPTESTFRGAAGDAWWHAGVDYNPGLRYRPLGGTAHLGADAALRGAGGVDFNVWSLTGRIIWPLTPKENTRFWGGFGGGVYFIHTGTISGFAAPGLKFSFGANITERWYFEADYDYISGFTDNAGIGQRADGVTVAIGVRL